MVACPVRHVLDPNANKRKILLQSVTKGRPSEGSVPAACLQGPLGQTQTVVGQ
jgi:hypothetical protein